MFENLSINVKGAAEALVQNKKSIRIKREISLLFIDSPLILHFSTNKAKINCRIVQQ